MPIRGTKGVRPRYIEFPAELDEAVDAFATARGQTFKAVVVDACRRHLAYPPPLPPPPVPPPPAPAPAPLPDVAAGGETPPPKAKRGRPKNKE